MVSCEHEWKKTHFNHKLLTDALFTPQTQSQIDIKLQTSSCRHILMNKLFIYSADQTTSLFRPVMRPQQGLRCCDEEFVSTFHIFDFNSKNKNVPVGCKISIICKKSLHYKVKSFEEDIFPFLKVSLHSTL